MRRLRRAGHHTFLNLSTVSPLLIFSLFIGRGVRGGRKRKLDCFSAELPGESEYEYFGRFLYDTPKSVGWKEWLTWTLELMLLFTSYTFVMSCQAEATNPSCISIFEFPDHVQAGMIS